MRELKSLLPSVWEDIPEMQVLQEALQPEMERLAEQSDQIITDTFVDQLSEERLSEWEKRLTIIPQGNVMQRRLYLKSVIRGFGKLNETKIKSIVNALTEGTAIVTFEDGVIIVRVLPPDNGEIFLFPDVERSLEKRIPVHLGLKVIRYYSTWADIANDFLDWEAVKNNFTDWQDVSNYIKMKNEVKKSAIY